MRARDGLQCGNEDACQVYTPICNNIMSYCSQIRMAKGRVLANYVFSAHLCI